MLLNLNIEASEAKNDIMLDIVIKTLMFEDSVITGSPNSKDMVKIMSYHQGGSEKYILN